ncbi:uncharacterized protein KY384_006776 [Bacidia gigantensis]|uniref:uncharacterized protein n=1 Tax=Bacidia gigantensis TaxID=2732470 RepID=UPI001D041E42|nr:uncharacterized protein KY384_006776 [Bacidia gigantensis]KAG8527860.1 hypothetical protein KY384_006776 [Bacidia gigantensis]
MGRPHPPREGSSSKKSEQPKSHTTSRHGSIDSRSIASSHDPQDFLGYDMQNCSIDEYPENTFGDGSALDFCGSGMPPYQMNSLQTDPSYLYEPPRENASAFGAKDDLSRSSSNGTMCSNDSIFSQCSNYGSSMSSVGSSSGLASQGRSKGQDFDCATTAMNILQELNMTSIKPSAEIDPPSLDATTNAASAAIKRISTILVCPCSQKTDIALLASVVCAAILDTYATILHKAGGSKSRKSSSGMSKHSTMSMVKDVMRDADVMDLCPSGSPHIHGGSIKKKSMMRVLEDLPKVAKLVDQFSRRYKKQGNGSDDFLPALATSLKSGLKSLTNEATNWVAQ